MGVLDPAQLIPLALSINTFAVMWLVGNHRILGWVLGVLGQCGWFVFIAVFDAYGFLPLAVALTYVYTRNLLKWAHETEETKEE